MSRNKALLLGSLVLVAVVALVIANLPNQEGGTPSQSKELNCAFDTWLGYSAFYVADELGYFEDEGLSVNLSVMNSLQEKNAAMIRGDLHCMGGSIDSAVISTSSGVPGKIVFLFESSRGNDTLVTAKTIQSAGDLKGKKIGLEVGYVAHLFLLRYLQLSDLTPKDVQIVDMTNEQGAAAFVSNSIDALSNWEPFTSQALKREGGHILASSKGMKELFCGTLYASEAAISERPEDLKKLVAALQRANTYWKDNPKEGNAIVAKRWEMLVEEVEAIMVNTTIFVGGDQERMFKGGELSELLNICEELWRSSGEVKEDVDTDQLFDGQFVSPLYNAPLKKAG